MTILTADILDRDPAGAARLRACLEQEPRYDGLRRAADGRSRDHRPFMRMRPRGARLHGLAVGAFMAASAAATVAASRFTGF